MKQFLGKAAAIACLIGLPFMAAAQDQGTPTPTPVPLNPFCSGGPADPNTLLVNGDFEADSRVGLPPRSWEAGSSGLGGVLLRQTDASGTGNNFVELRNGSAITQVPVAVRTASNIVYQIRMCAFVVNGFIRVTVGGRVRGIYPLGAGSGTFSGLFESEEFRADLSPTGVQDNRVEITFVGTGGVAYIDNVELVPYLVVGGDETPEPTATPELPTPTPTPTVGPSSTPTPTLAPGLPTFTPTPLLTANSVQVTADPPLLLTSPDDFASTSGSLQQILIGTKVIGANGQEINILDIDEDATIRFTIDTRGEAANVGTIAQKRNGNTEQAISTQQLRLEDLGDSPVIYKPLKPYDGTIRVIVDVEYDTLVNGKEEKVEIRGVVPIISRTRASASLSGKTGSFDASRNSALGRQPGDRGFRPDQRTNLYFREREQVR